MPRRIRCKHCQKLFSGFFGQNKTCESCIGKSEETLNTVPLFPASVVSHCKFCRILFEKLSADHNTCAKCFDEINPKPPVMFPVAVESCRLCKKPFNKGDRIAFTANDPDSYRHYECLDSLKESVESTAEPAPPVTTEPPVEAPLKLVEQLRSILQSKENKRAEADIDRLRVALITRVTERSDLYFDIGITMKSSVEWLMAEGITVERIGDAAVTSVNPPMFRLSGWDTSGVKSW